MDAQNKTMEQTTALNLDSQTSHGENNVSSIPASSGDQFSAAPGNDEQESQATVPLSELAMKQFAHVMELQKSYTRACLDPDQMTAGLLLRQSVQDLKNHYGRDVMVEYYGDNPEHSDTSVLRPQMASLGSSQTRHPGGTMMGNVHSSASGLDARSPHLQQQIVPPGNNTVRLICIKGQVPTFCVDPHGSRFIQQALAVATPREIAMVYEEIMPIIHTLAVDVFANHALQKLLDHGPRYYQREFINRLTGHILALSLHIYGCWVIQKAFEVGELDQKVQMAKELDGKIVRCVRDPYGTHVIQKCIQCLPPKHIQFMFRSLYGKAKALSMHPYGCHVMQKALAFCSIPEIYHSLSSEIVEAANELSLDQFGNGVVQHMLVHGGPAERSTMVSKFAGRTVSMSRHRFASSVVEKCLAFGSDRDRRLITDEMVGAGQQLEHLVEMMTDPYGSLVMEKVVATAEESKVAVLVDVARSNLAALTGSPHGRLVVAGIERLLTAKAGRQVRLAVPPLPPQ